MVAPPSVSQKNTNPTRPGEEQGGRLPRKKGSAVLWPWRGRWGQRLRRRALSNGGIRSGGNGSSRTVRDTAVVGVGGPGPVRREIANKEVECDSDHPQGKV